MGWIVLGIFCGFVLGFFGLVGYLELGYRIGRRRRERGLHDFQREGIEQLRKHNGLVLDSRERRRLVQRELDKLGR